MLRVSQAILHVFDFDAGATFFSQRTLDLGVRATKSYVQRRLRRISANAESRHGVFAPDSAFAAELARYFAGERDFQEFSVDIAQWFWEELRRAEDLEQADLLVADFTDTEADKADKAAGADGASGGPASEAELAAAFEGERGARFFAVALLPRRTSFVHEVDGETNDIGRLDSTLPNPTQKIDSYLLVDASTLAIDYHDKLRSVGGEAVEIIPQRLLQCTSAASSHEVIDEVSGIVEHIALEAGLASAVEVGRVKAAVARRADVDEAFSPADLGREVFHERPDLVERYERDVAEAELPAEAPVRRGVARRLASTHRIRTDTGIEISFPSELAERPGYIDFFTEPDGHIQITISNVARIENR